MTTWAEHAVLWHVYPLGFVGAPHRSGPDEPVVHRLAMLEDWLDYAIGLGASGLLLGPVFASTSHGYDTLDHLRVDPRLGDRSDLDRLVEQAHARGLRVVLDGVFNHVGADHPAFRRALAGGLGSPDAELFRLTWPDGPDAPPAHADFEGHHDLVALNHDSPAVAELVRGVMTHWLAAGIDGWRLDAAYAVPAEFWAGVIGPVRERFPDAWFLGEVIHGDYPGFVVASGVDSVTQYELWKAIWSALVDRNLYELAHALGRHDGFAATFAPQTFVGNHDVTRIATRLADDGGDERLLGHALAVLCTVAGVPSVYAGDEQAFRGLKEERFGGDDAIRPAFPPTPDGLAPDGAWAHRLHAELIGLRRRHTWLHRARTEVLELSNTHLAYRATPRDGLDGPGTADEALLVLLNVGADDWHAPVAGTVLAGAADPAGATTRVPGVSWAVLRP